MSVFSPSPCEHPCETPCEDREHGCDEPTGGQTPGFLAKLFKMSLYNALDVCFDAVYEEPKTILIIGGCRQRDLAQHIALMLPAAKIVLVDPDAAIAKQAEEEICCRFKFITAPLEAMPFEDNEFDLVIAHNLLAYTGDWAGTVSEIGRVTARNVFFTHQRPLLWSMLKHLPGAKSALAAQGIDAVPSRLPAKYDLLSQFYRFCRMKACLSPLPWTAYMALMNPVKEEKTVLASS